MKNKKLIIACIVVMLIIAIGLGAGLNISATKKYESAMELIEEYTSSFETQEEVDEMEHIYDKFLADEKLSSYYGKNDTFDECYDLAKEEMERAIQKEKDRLAEEAKQEAVEDKDEEVVEELPEEVTVESNNEAEEKEEENISSNSNNSANNQSTQSTTTDNNNNNSNSQASNSSTSTESTTTATSSKYDIVRPNGDYFKCPSEIAKLAPSKGIFYMYVGDGIMIWSTGDGNDDTGAAPSYSCEAKADGIPIPGTIYRNGVLADN